LTGGASLLHQLVATNPAAMVLAVFVLWGVVLLPLGTWTASWRIDRGRLSSALPTTPSVSPVFEG
jgi:hypothetical protein